MADALKSFFSPSLVRRLSADIVRVYPAFPVRTFVKQACAGLEDRELMDRGKHIAAALAKCLPPQYPDAIAVLLSSLGPEHGTDELIGVGMAPFFYLPHVIFIAERGLNDFKVSIHAQYELTKRFSAEFSMRPFIAKDPERSLEILRRWTSDKNPHVRRLASECTRLRLPWAARVPWLDAHPERVIEVLALLKDDPSTLVRRSVANNLNDISKVRPDLVRVTCAAWLKEDISAGRRAIVEHALRSAVKRGEPYALKLLGYGRKASVSVEDVRFDPRRVAIGGRVSITFTMRSTSRTSQELLVDVAVHFVKASSRTSPKVFKLRRVALPPGGRETLRATVSMAVHTTRKPHPGEHAVDIVINGAAQRAGSFWVTPARG